MKLLYKGAMSASFTLALAAAPVIAGGLSKPIEPTPQEAQANVLNVPVMKGNVTAANSSSTIKSNGIYQIPTGPGQEFEPISLGMYGTFGNFEQNGFYFTSDRTSDGLLVTVHHSVWDAKTGSYITSFTSGPDQSTMAIDCAVDPTTGAVYGATFDINALKYQLSIMQFNRNTAKATKVGNKFDCQIAALACTKDGQLYAISRDVDKDGNVVGSTLLKVNKNDATYEKIGTGTGCVPRYNGSATIDPATGRMYWTVCPPDDKTGLYEVDLTTGKASLIYEFPGSEQVVGLSIIGMAAEDKAPAAPYNLNVNFEKASLTGTFTCDIPAATFDGEAATGEIMYTVLVDGSDAGKGKVNYGGKISHPVTVPGSGVHKFSVYTTNSVGNSPTVKFEAFVGAGKPAAPGNANATWADGVMTLTWDAVTTSADGGYIDPADMDYLVRGSDGQIIAENIKDTRYTINVAEPDKPRSYYYMVSAHSGDKYSDVTKTNAVSLGAYTPPFESPFSKGREYMDGYIVIDSNNDGRTWIWDDNYKGVRAPYNTDHVTPMDDWLITPGIRLKAGQAYDLSFDASVMEETSPETFEVKFGKANTVDGMTTELIPATTISNVDPEKQTARIVAREDGVYYVGIHCISEADKYYLFVNNLSLSSQMNGLAPDMPSDFKVVPADGGVFSAEISLKAPTRNVEGDAVGTLQKVVVERDGKEIKSFENPAPDAELEFTDTPEKGGRYKYTAAAYNASGRGLEAFVEAVIGYDAPAAPVNVQAKETSNLGEVSVTWNKVTTDSQGKDLPDGLVKYKVYLRNTETGDWDEMSASIADNSYTLKCLQDIDEQTFAFIGVSAYTEAGESRVVSVMPVAVGTAYDGIKESAADGSITYNWNFDGTCVGMGIFGDRSIKACSSQDGDNGYFYMRGDGLDQYGTLQSGKVKIADEAPALTFYTYNFSSNDGDEDTNPIEVSVRISGEETSFKTIQATTVNEIAMGSTDPKWVKCVVPLDRYAGKTIEFILRGAIRSFSYVTFDNIVVGTIADKDLLVENVSAPSRVKSGEKFDITMNVLNNGAYGVSGWNVDLFKNNVKVGTQDGRTLDPGESAVMKFEMTMERTDDKAVEYRAVVNFDGDENYDNNESATIKVSPVLPVHPRATELEAKEENLNVSLSWKTPELSPAPQTVTADFEDADDFAHDYADWTFVDVDGIPVAGITEIEIPGIVNKETTASFFVFNRSALGVSESQFGAHSGSKYLASLVSWDDGEINDWAISPELSGKAQTVSFYARSFQSAYPEKVEVLYSTGSTNIADFKVAAEAKSVPGAWTEFTAQIPEGAKYFAIRSCATAGFMLMVDDVKYEARALADKYKLVGYNLYRNGVKLNDAPLTTTTYADKIEDKVHYDYQVTVVYENGESAPSNMVGVGISGVEGIEIGAADGNAVYYDLQGIRVARPVKGGIYIRTANGRSEKVIIR